MSITLGILLVVVFVLVGKNSAGKSKNGGPTIEVVEPIDSSYSPTILNQLQDANTSKDFTVKPDLNGLGNTNLFGH